MENAQIEEAQRIIDRQALREERAQRLELDALDMIRSDLANLSHWVDHERLIDAIGVAIRENSDQDADEMLGHLVKRFVNSEIKVAARKYAEHKLAQEDGVTDLMLPQLNTLYGRGHG